MRALALIGFVALALSAAPAFAHESSARRTVVTQVEDDKLSVLVTWTAPTGASNAVLLAAAAASPEQNKRIALRSLMARRALSPLRITVNGKRVRFSAVDSKLRLDPGPLGRHTVAVLATLPLPTAHATIRVLNSSAEATRLTWTDRTSETAEVLSSHPQSTWTRNASFTLTWLRK